MKLPSMKYVDGIRKQQQVKFKGLHHSLEASDGELWDMKNLTSDYYPVLATRAPRLLFRKLERGGGIFDWEGLAWVDGTDFFFRGERKGSVSEGEKHFASMGPYIVILPDKCYYNVDTGAFGSMEAEWTGEQVRFENGLLYEVEAAANTIVCQGVDWAEYFRAGDAVEISGCTVHPENNKTIVIRAIDGDKLYFYEYSFTLDGEEGYTEEGPVTIRRSVPDMKFLCENENRLWGCSDDTIYASKLGDIFNWNVYDGLESDVWAVTPGSAGHFTGCISYRGFPVFFKENYIYKVYGSLPSEFQPMGSATLGLAEGGSGSLAVAAETLFYLSPNGIMAYTGGIPQPMGEAFGTMHFRRAVAGSDGLKYYASMEDDSGGVFLYVYDTQQGTWHKEDATNATHFARSGGNLYCLNDQGEIWIMGRPAEPPEGCEEESKVKWAAEFADFTEEDPNKKGVSKIQIRLELDKGASAKVWIQFDSNGKWQAVSTLKSDGAKRSFYLPIIPRRGDHYRLKLTGTGGCRVYSMVRELYSGSELRSKPGRN